MPPWRGCIGLIGDKRVGLVPGSLIVEALFLPGGEGLTPFSLGSVPELTRAI